MIVSALLDFFLAPIYLLLDALDFSLNTLTIPLGIFNGLNNLFGLIGYIFPTKQLIGILTFSLTLTVAQFGMTLLYSLISFIPTMSGK